ncbi:YhcN/YlaJ family sporulation lipoprotein [Bacillus cytotoxicus]|uniref:Sporulation lipoprotein YhcN/YlaJ n=1 Tax=Bacillus cytotoxicus (strain DSM 22905 / CIP 110041 / 391-98 / NVH 391-98) TaxID=315749 RepID=A7GSG4_BACCN|nr:YhcN/YlaJ family sporulation lipoprotein [Bacillus cytotoxicus]ABS23072.1 Sporulation lipoprotein YhcN/YlaJ [Bacillus cytotoxicus NVH 391-98]AWC45701.1 YhcN/YlaJ family sporulation lipoprotein [Bacillus cytotoxicus]MDH2863415.1 YhcN/YlaJ family sporulation lipoprotein [Bacillus cytotoxicus]MDH2884201.1 YhcN/YlaJ family sporulation lipoprotein [Bacillus cytotoxicus]NZD32478.1 YhcN/YlaJ family sporulation lipoprotein [Bacillus cytotoxicus]
MKKLKICSIISLATISLFGCAGNQKDNALDNRDHDNIRNVRYEGNQTDLQRGRNVPNDITNNDTRLHIANKAADRIVELKEIDTANVIVTNRNAYVAVVLRNHVKGELTRELEKRVADQVRAIDPNIRYVFVSSNPDFVNRMRDYAAKIDQGKPVRGLIEEFNETVRRVFPNSR